MEPLILAIDQGTSSTKALLFNTKGQVVSQATAPLQTEYFTDGRVEQDPVAICSSVEQATRECLKGQNLARLKGIGISNQRETFVLWDQFGTPIYPAVVWSCKRSVSLCQDLKAKEAEIHEKTGLLIDPYFSGTKVLWLMQHRPELAEKVALGAVYFGTVDTWLLYRLTEGKSYYTDHTNASRTLFFNLKTLNWDTDILSSWNLQNLHLPEVKPSAGDFGATQLFGLLSEPVPVLAMIGDSHAALFGEACFEPGDTKITLGTGCSLLSHAGSNPNSGGQGILSTIGWSTPNEVIYAREGAIVACGSMIEWLISVGLVSDPQETEVLARNANPDAEIILIPAFSGLGAPFWDANRKAAFLGLNFGTTREELVRATLESIGFQIRAVLDAMESESGFPIGTVALHGGLSGNSWILEFLCGLLTATIRLQENANVSAQGAAMLAGLSCGIYANLEEISNLIRTQKLSPAQEPRTQAKYQHWLERIKTTQS